MKTEKGFMLVEVLVSIALLSIVGVLILNALSTSSISLGIAEERATAKNLAEGQMQSIRKSAYNTSYIPAPISGEYDGYSAAITAMPITARDSNLQRIRITISHGPKQVMTLEDYKVNR